MWPICCHRQCPVSLSVLRFLRQSAVSGPPYTESPSQLREGYMCWRCVLIRTHDGNLGVGFVPLSSPGLLVIRRQTGISRRSFKHLFSFPLFGCKHPPVVSLSQTALSLSWGMSPRIFWAHTIPYFLASLYYKLHISVRLTSAHLVQYCMIFFAYFYPFHIVECYPFNIVKTQSFHVTIEQTCSTCVIT